MGINKKKKSIKLNVNIISRELGDGNNYLNHRSTLFVTIEV